MKHLQLYQHRTTVYKTQSKLSFKLTVTQEQGALVSPLLWRSYVLQFGSYIVRLYLATTISTGLASQVKDQLVLELQPGLIYNLRIYLLNESTKVQ